MSRILLFLFASAFALQGANFYVAPTGLDTNTGTSALPWATLQKAVDTIKPGDVIMVLPGTYAGFRIESSGTSAAAKKIMALTRLTVVVNRPGPRNRHTSNIEVENFSGVVSNWVIEGFDSMGSPRYGFDLRNTSAVTVKNGRARNSVLTGIFTAFSEMVVIENNESLNNGEHGIYHSNSGDYAVIRLNLSHHNYGAGIHMNGDLSMGGDGQISFSLIDSNILWENGRGGGSAINCDGVDDSVFRNNLMFNNHASGISLYAGDGARGSSRNLVHNNTIVMAADGRWAVNIPASTSGRSNPVGNRVFNNILYTPHTFRGSVSVAGTAVSGFASDYNVVVNQFSVDSGGNKVTWAQWKAYGYDTHSLISTPALLFVDAANGNYQLKPGSPAINTGAFLDHDVPQDILGVSRPQFGAFDIGCLEATVR
jgi:hypothetical protein